VAGQAVQTVLFPTLFEEPLVASFNTPQQSCDGGCVRTWQPLRSTPNSWIGACSRRSRISTFVLSVGRPEGSLERRLTLTRIAEPMQAWGRIAYQGPGVYAWYFRGILPGVPTHGCLCHEGSTLHYLRIAPKAPPINGPPPSRQRLRDRIRDPYRGKAEGSTLRLTLGCLLADRLGIVLRRVGSGKRLTFGAGEAALSAWMGENALVAWLVDPLPWKLEARLIRKVYLPLNLDKNAAHPFHAVLSDTRRRARVGARELPILPCRRERPRMPAGAPRDWLLGD
jgi:hypothetical protein